MHTSHIASRLAALSVLLVVTLIVLGALYAGGATPLTPWVNQLLGGR
jgi:hypothetical protein